MDKDMAPSKPVLPPLKTPKTATFPSELHNDSLYSRSDIKTENSLTTPITPPLAYTEFLKALTPVFNSPISPAASFSKFPIEKMMASISQPSTATSVSFPNGGDFVKSATISPDSPYAPPISARSFSSGRKRLRISTAKACGKEMSPTTDSPLSATTAYSPFSPADWKLRYMEGSRSATVKPVSVRQVVTRTITYKRTPLDPPPKGKRRRTSSPSES